MRWIAQLVQPGSSLGGARPKASVIDENKNLCIAKFPSRKDDYDAGLWEHFSHLLAKNAGINAAGTRIISTMINIILCFPDDLTDEKMVNVYTLLQP